jgi:hypothetical protein
VNYFIRFASATLSIALVAGADTAPKRSADPNTTITPSSRSTLGFSPWRAIYLQRNGVVNWRKRKDFNDLRFEYRWKSESSVIRQDCTVEIRPSEDVDVADTIPTITVAYIDPHGHPHMPPWVTNNLAISHLSHAYLRPPDCERIDLVYWSK